MTHGGGSVWLNGECYNVAYLYDYEAGTVKRRVTLTGHVGTTAGMGRRCGGRFVAVYVHPQGRELALQVGQTRFPLDGSTSIEYQARCAGLWSEAVVTRGGKPQIVLRQGTIVRAIFKLIDVAYGYFDESADDFLLDIADIAASRDRQLLLPTVKDPLAGPWHELS